MTCVNNGAEDKTQVKMKLDRREKLDRRKDGDCQNNHEVRKTRDCDGAKLTFTFEALADESP